MFMHCRHGLQNDNKDENIEIHNFPNDTFDC